MSILQRIGGILVTFTIVSLEASISYALITVQPPNFVFPCRVLVCVSPWHSNVLFATSGRRSQEKGTDVGEFSRCSASTVQELQSADQNFLTHQKFI